MSPSGYAQFVAWLLGAAKGYAPKLVNPGGVEVWKQQSQGNVHGLDDPVGHFEVTPRQILQGVAQAASELKLPHRVHVHANNLGMPGNWSTTLATLEALEGFGGHLTHIQFHSYGGGQGDPDTFSSKVSQLAAYVNDHPSLTVDVGQVMFGPTTSMTGDGPLGYYLSNIYKTKWFSIDTELEAGCGIAPIEYKNKSLVHALQWAIGLEWYLLVTDPWRVAMSTDHPNGGSFMAYPQIIRLLMDRTWRRDVLKTVHPLVRERTVLADLDREYSLSEICIITRSGPARMLGLKHKGHLGPGADADLTIYTPDENKQTMFELPRYVIKAGEIIVDGGEIRDPLGQDIARCPRLRPGHRGRPGPLVRAVLFDPAGQLSGQRRLLAARRAGRLRVGTLGARLTPGYRCAQPWAVLWRTFRPASGRAIPMLICLDYTPRHDAPSAIHQPD